VLCGLSWARPPFAFHRHRPDIRQVLLCLTGMGRGWIDGAWQPCGPGQGYLTPSAAPHAYEAEAGSSWEVCWVTYQQAVDGIVAIQAPALVAADPRGMWAAIQGLYLEAQGVASPAAMAAWVELVDLHARRACAALTPSTPPNRLARLWEAVDADLAHKWTLNDLARMAEVGPEQLRRLSLRETGRAPLGHVSWLRMRRAASLLSAHGPTVASVAEAVGYDDPFAFSTAFKRAHGVTPSSLRSTGPGR
jgi:AraC-like DNA-binding protein